LLFLAQQNKVSKSDTVILKDGFYCDLVNGSLKALSVVYSIEALLCCKVATRFPSLRDCTS